MIGEGSHRTGTPTWRCCLTKCRKTCKCNLDNAPKKESVWAGHVARMGEERGVYRILVGKPEGKRPLGRPRRRWVDNIRMDLQEVGCGYVDWIGLAQDRDRWRTLVSTVMNLRVPWNAGNFLTSCKPVSFSSRTLHHGVSTYYSYNNVKNYYIKLWNIFKVGGVLVGGCGVQDFKLHVGNINISSVCFYVCFLFCVPKFL